MHNSENDKKEKPHVNVGTIGHIDHGITSALSRAALIATIAAPKATPLLNESHFGTHHSGPDLYTPSYKARHLIVTDADKERLAAAEAKRARKAEKRRIEWEKRNAKTRKS